MECGVVLAYPRRFVCLLSDRFRYCLIKLQVQSVVSAGNVRLGTSPESYIRPTTPSLSLSWSWRHCLGPVTGRCQLNRQSVTDSRGRGGLVSGVSRGGEARDHAPPETLASPCVDTWSQIIEYYPSSRSQTGTRRAEPSPRKIYSASLR